MKKSINTANTTETPDKAFNPRKINPRLAEKIRAAYSRSVRDRSMGRTEPYSPPLPKTSVLTGWVPLGSPLGWTDHEHVREYTDRFGPVADCYQHSKENIEKNHAFLHAELSRAITYFLKHEATMRGVPMSAISLREKVQWLEDIIRSRSADLEYLGRFGEVFAYTLWVDCERERLLRACRNLAARLALAPLGMLSDYLENAAIELAEAMTACHEDYAGITENDDFDPGILEEPEI